MSKAVEKTIVETDEQIMERIATRFDILHNMTKGAIKNYTGVHMLRGVQICSNCSVRGIYTSCNIYDWDTLPKELSFKLVKGGKW